MSKCILVDSKEYEELIKEASRKKDIRIIVNYRISTSGIFYLNETIVESSEHFDLAPGLVSRIRSSTRRFFSPKNIKAIEDCVSDRRRLTNEKVIVRTIDEYLDLSFWDKFRLLWKSSSSDLYKSWGELLGKTLVLSLLLSSCTIDGVGTGNPGKEPHKRITVRESIRDKSSSYMHPRVLEITKDHETHEFIAVYSDDIGLAHWPGCKYCKGPLKDR